MTKKKLFKWKEILENVGKDPAATIVYLYFDELAHFVGKHAEQYGDCSVIYCDLCRKGNGEIDGSLLDKAEYKAWTRFQKEWGHLLPKPSKRQVDELIWSLGG